MSITLIVICWFVAGIVKTFFWEGGWLIMITDERNVRNTWVSIPLLFIVWMLWPFPISRWAFLFMHRFGL